MDDFPSYISYDMLEHTHMCIKPRRIVCKVLEFVSTLAQDSGHSAYVDKWLGHIMLWLL